MSKGYYTRTEVTDYGPYVTKLILPVPAAVSAVPEGAFSVYVERLDDKGEVLQVPKSWMALDDREPSKGYVPTRAAYPSDRQGNRQETGEFITLETAYGPTYSLSAGITAVDGFNVPIKTRYQIVQTQELETADGPVTGLRYAYPLGDDRPDQKGWINDRSSGEKEESLNYGYFIPQVRNAGKRPLIVWLHGAGEGGQDPTIAYISNKVVALAGEKIQGYFGGAYILVPQTKTFWMNDGSGEYHAEGKTIYGKALKACVDEFIEKNPGVDRDRVYLGGDSNGGFMTMRMVVDYPGFFAAAFPVCEALYDNVISDEDIQRLKDLPIWFTHAKNDPVVDPAATAEATYKRLIAAGAQNAHLTLWDKIEDIRGAFDPVDGKPFEYIGHFAWIPVFNDDCRLDYDGKSVTAQGREVGLLEWLALQSR